MRSRNHGSRTLTQRFSSQAAQPAVRPGGRRPGRVPAWRGRVARPRGEAGNGGRGAPPDFRVVVPHQGIALVVIQAVRAGGP